MVTAENRADLADHPRLIVVLDDQHRAAERRFDRNAVQRHEAQAGRLEHRAFHPAVLDVGVELDRQQAGEMPRARTARFDDVDAALLRRGTRVHDRYAA